MPLYCLPNSYICMSRYGGVAALYAKMKVDISQRTLATSHTYLDPT